jgi:hypothetical protein
MSTPSFTVTYYNLFLGDQDAVTGWFRKGFTIESVTMAIIPKGNVQVLSGLGLYSRHDAVGLTNYSVKTGSIVKDSFDAYYLIVGLEPWKWGNQFVYYACDLEELADFPFIAGFFGFEDDEHSSHDGCEFEDGFERGYWAL